MGISWSSQYIQGVRTHHIFKDKGQRLAGVHNVVQGHNVAVFQFFEQRCLAYGRERSTLLLLQSYLFQCNALVG